MSDRPSPDQVQPLLPFPAVVPADYVCAGCGYSLGGLTVIRCPECGRATSELDLRQNQARAGLCATLPGLTLRWALWSIAVAVAIGLATGIHADHSFAVIIGYLAASLALFALVRVCARFSPGPLRVAYICVFTRSVPSLLLPMVAIPVAWLLLALVGQVHPEFARNTFIALVVLTSILIASGTMFAQRWNASEQAFGTRTRPIWIALAVLTGLLATALGLLNGFSIMVRIFGL